MKVDKNVYPDIKTIGDIVLTNTLDKYSNNLDESIFYSSSNGRYSVLSEGVITGSRYPKTYVALNNSKKNYQTLILTYSEKNLIDKKDTYKQINENSFNPYKGDYSTLHLINSFKYYSICAVPYVHYSSINAGSNRVNTTNVNDFFTNYNNDNYAIVGITVKIFIGTNTKRNNANASIVDIANYSIPNITKNESGYEISESTQIQNLFPKYHSSLLYLYNMVGITSYPYETYETSLNGVCGRPFMNFNAPFVNNENTVTPWEDSFNNQFPKITLTKNDVLEMVATLGLIFSPNPDIAQNLNLSIDNNIEHDELYFPIKSASGLWQGEYTHGKNNKTTEQYKNKWNDDVNAPFTHGSPAVSEIDNRIFGDDDDRNMFATSQIFTHRYIVNSTQLRQLSDYLNNSDKNLLNNIIQNLKVTGDNPINSIVSIMSIPFLPVGTGSPQPIIVGDNLINIGTEENKIALNSVGTLNIDTFSVNLGSADIKQEFNNYLDFSPYTQYYAYVPFCNIVELDTDVIMNKTISFQLNCDTLSGTCECEIRVNGNLYKIVSGNFAYPVMISGANNAEYTSKMMSTLGKYVSGVGAMVAATAGVATGGLGVPIAAAGLAAGVGTTFSSLYEFNTTPRNFSATGTSSGGLTHILPDRVCIYRYSVSDLSDTNYGHFVGYACEFSETLNNLTGFTVCANAKVETNATNTEKEKIKELLENGVYL